ncbi:MAG: quinohemoprotein amine dehydrogenase subunit alpha [Acidobacteria bacterium]|nr:MAG: quinohemoprotein amine dehydrogenase subunit alpha [Acidobacteriota bacterium]
MFALPFFSSGTAQEKPPEKPASVEKSDEGIPIGSDVVVRSCSPCHKLDDKKRMSRISYRRTTPEGWQETIKRMVRLNKVDIQPEQARQVLKYLANNLGLAPEEAGPAAFEVEKRMIDFKYSDRDTESVCSKCHSMGRVIAQRRTKEEWELLVAMHRGYYPLSDFQAFRRMGPPQREPGPDGRPPDNRHPMEKAIAHLSGAFPLRTPEWAAWSATMRPPRLAGRWALSGYQLGRGPVYGTVTIRADAEDEFATEARYVYARKGHEVKRSGKALVYTGFQWRGRSSVGAAEGDAMREVMTVDRDWRRMTGRWFAGAYDELGFDVRLERVGQDAIVLGTDLSSLRAGTTGKRVRIDGVNLPASPAAKEIDFGPGIRVERIVSAAPEAIVVEVGVASDAAVGARDLFVAGAARPAALVVYDHVDSIKVLPAAGMARVGGANFPRQYQQFEGVAFHNGPDGKPDTKDDLNLGLVDVAWSIEEYTAVFGDDDKEFVGTIDSSGLFIPNLDGPNPKRRNNANNYGDVWVVATYTPEAGTASTRPIRARAHLVVTVPLYMKWDQPEVAR